jgi:hypothetical protein
LRYVESEGAVDWRGACGCGQGLVMALIAHKHDS